MDARKTMDPRASWSPQLNTLLPKRTARKTAVLATTLPDSCAMASPSGTAEPSRTHVPSASSTSEITAACSTLAQTSFASPCSKPDHDILFSSDDQAPAEAYDSGLLSTHPAPSKNHSIDHSVSDQDTCIQKCPVENTFVQHSVRHLQDQSSANWPAFYQHSAAQGITIPSVLHAPIQVTIPGVPACSIITSAASYQPVERLEDVSPAVRQGHYPGHNFKQRIAIDDDLDQVIIQFASAASVSTDDSTNTPIPGPSTDNLRRAPSSDRQDDQATADILFAILDSHIQDHEKATSPPPPADTSVSKSSGLGDYERDEDEGGRMADDMHVKPWDTYGDGEANYGAIIPFCYREYGIPSAGCSRRRQRGVHRPSPLRIMVCVSDADEAEI